VNYYPGEARINNSVNKALDRVVNFFSILPGKCNSFWANRYTALDAKNFNILSSARRVKNKSPVFSV
jgi:hypothetical protein